MTGELREDGAAVCAAGEPLLREYCEVAAGGHLGHAEGCLHLADRDAASLVEPTEDLSPPFLGDQAGSPDYQSLTHASRL